MNRVCKSCFHRMFITEKKFSNSFFQQGKNEKLRRLGNCLSFAANKDCRANFYEYCTQSWDICRDLFEPLMTRQKKNGAWYVLKTN